MQILKRALGIVLITFLICVLLIQGFSLISNQSISDISYIENIKGIDLFEKNTITPRVYGNSFVDFSKDVATVMHNVNLAELEQQEIIEDIKKVEIDTNNMIFVGNSLVEGLRLTSNSSNTFLCKVGISLEGLKSKIYKQLNNYTCDIVIIGMGSNELGGYSESKFKNSYMDLVNHIRSINSGSNIICLSIPPVSQNKSNNSHNFNNTNVKKYNGYIQELCNENNLIYLDNTPFFGEVLESKKTSDGMHLKGNVYKAWYDFILNSVKEL